MSLRDQVIPEIEFTFSRSSGPGGQNVNKVNSKAQLRWNVLQSEALIGLSQELRNRILARLSARLNNDGELVLASDQFRDQTRNREDCLEKLWDLLERASHVPKKRVKTKPSRSSREKSKVNKRKQSDKKKTRSRYSSSHDDY